MKISTTKILMKEEVFISYAWIKAIDGLKSHENIVSDIEKALKKDFNVVIDKKHIKYKDNIKEFKKHIKQICLIDYFFTICIKQNQ